MKVLLLTSDAYGANGGIALYNRDVVEALASMPEVKEIVVVARHMPSEAIGVPTKARLRTASIGGKTRFIKTVVQEAGETYGLVICGHIHLLPLAVVINQPLGAPLVLMVYGIDVWQPPSRLARHWLKCVDAVWSISAITTERMNHWAALPSARYVQLPNAIHPDRYGMAPRNAELQSRHGLAGARVILTLARLPAKERYKGVDEVLEAMPALLQTIPNLKYLVCGEGNDRPRLMGHEYIEFISGLLRKRGEQPSNQRWYDTKIFILSPDSAYSVSLREEINVKKTSRVTFILQKKKGEWRIMHGHFSYVPE